ncbi:MAG: hypothetical protein NZM42_13245 [Gemmatales bacterium]|nr:hypothetical protein [Gemmatales bacterium]MDW8222305.1 hypothetical protein [Gemmatales bacterium]
MTVSEWLEESDINQQMARLRAWEEELRHRETVLQRRERELAEREEVTAASAPTLLQELDQLQQRIRNARRRLLALSEEYERLRARTQQLRQAGAKTPGQENCCAARQREGAEELSGSELKSASAGAATVTPPSAPAWAPVWYRLHPEPHVWLARLAGDLLDRAHELHQWSVRCAELRRQWLQDWQDALRELETRTRQLQQWQETLTERQTCLSQAEAECAERQRQLQARELRLQAAETRCDARHRALQQAFSQLKSRWRTATQTLRQRELRLQCLLDDWHEQTQRHHAHWQKLHQQAAYWIEQYARLAQQAQLQIAQLEAARYRLWLRQQALEMAIHLWTAQSSDAPAAEALLQECEHQLAERLRPWQERLEGREHQLAQNWQAFQQQAAQLLQQQRQLEALRQRVQEQSLTEQWHAYCSWAARQADQVMLRIVEHERALLRQHQAALLRDLEHLAGCFLNESALLPEVAQAA